MRSVSSKGGAGWGIVGNHRKRSTPKDATLSRAASTRDYCSCCYLRQNKAEHVPQSGRKVKLKERKDHYLYCQSAKYQSVSSCSDDDASGLPRTLLTTLAEAHAAWCLIAQQNSRVRVLQETWTANCLHFGHELRLRLMPSSQGLDLQ